MIFDNKILDSMEEHINQSFAECAQKAITGTKKVKSTNTGANSLRGNIDIIKNADSTRSVIANVPWAFYPQFGNNATTWIYPKNCNYLKFRINDKWITCKKVHSYTGLHFMEDGIDAVINNAEGIMKKELQNQGWI